MKLLFKIILWIFGIVLVVVLALFTFIELSWDKTYQIPSIDIKASNDSAVIERGKYLANTISHCGGCHVPPDKIRSWDEGEDVPLSGGSELELPGFGIFRAPNLTSDKESGIGNLTDGVVARALRFTISHDGKALFPFMRFQDVSEYDLIAIVSYLRTQPAVKHEVKKTQYLLIGRALKAFGLIQPESPKMTLRKSVAIEPTIEYGKYAAYNLGNCYGCHTELDQGSGKYVGKPFAGKSVFPPDKFSEGYSFVSPNLTPDKETGVIANWTEEQFVNRFHSGRIHRGSPMPWGAFSRMNDVELKAIYRFLMSLEPVKNKINKTVFTPGESISLE